MLDLMIGIIVLFNMSQLNTIYTQNQIEGKLGMYQNWTTESNTRMNAPADDEYRTQLQQQFGDMKASGKSVWEIMSMNPFTSLQKTGTTNCFGDDCSFPWAYWLWFAIILVTVLINVLAVLEGFFILYSKKYT